MRFPNWFYVAEALFYQRRVLATHLRETLREGRERLALIKELTAQLEKLSAAYDQRVAERDALRLQLAKRPARAPRRSVKARA